MRNSVKKMDEKSKTSNFGVLFNEFIELLINNQFYEEKQLSQLLDNCEADTQLQTLIADIESRSGEELSRLCGLMIASGLVSDTVADSVDSGQCVNDGPKRYLKAFKDLIACVRAMDADVLTVTNASAIKSTEYGDVYPMASKLRGYCVIIDNEKFKVKFLERRTGTTADASRLSSVFKQLFFRVKLYENKTADKMKALLADIAADKALVKHDALVVIILSHGSTEGIYGTDGITVPLKTILEMFNNENCPQLIDKPKMFFTNACRGGKFDHGTRKSLGPSLAAMGAAPGAPIVSTWSDMFVYYSSIEGYVSTRSMFKGSWFGQELATCLAESAHREHLNDLVTITVAKRVSERIGQIDGQYSKQAIETHIRGSVKKVYFNPGLYLEN